MTLHMKYFLKLVSLESATFGNLAPLSFILNSVDDLNPYFVKMYEE